MALETYRAKRDFKATDEPAGSDRRGHGDAFVVQKHAARRLHYDLRLEVGDTLASWAVTKGPSLVPGEKRLAVRVDDHPLDYADFEGEIPKGQYGGGEVIVWDRGRWAPEGDPERGLRKGRLDFTLEGVKLKGRWHLVRMGARHGEKRENWLLIKGGDAEARSEADPDILEEAPGSVISGRTVEDIAAGRPARGRSGRRRRRPGGDALAGVRAAGAGDAEAEPAARRCLGARDQVRRLSAGGAGPGRQGEAPDPRRPGLDRPLRAGRRGAGGAPGADGDPRRRAGGRGGERGVGLPGAAGRPRGGTQRPVSLLPLRPALPRRPRPAAAAARRAQGGARRAPRGRGGPAAAQRALRGGWRGDAEARLPAEPRGPGVEAARRRLSDRAPPVLDQVEMFGAAGVRRRRLRGFLGLARARRIAGARRLPRRRARSRREGRHRLQPRRRRGSRWSGCGGSSARRRRSRASSTRAPGAGWSGCGPSSSPRSSSGPGPPRASCGTPPSAGCARTSRRARWSARRRAGERRRRRGRGCG